MGPAVAQIAPFEYAAPTRLDDALHLLHRHGPQARVLAGGTDLVISMRERGLQPSCLVDLKRIAGLSGIEVDSTGALQLGAMTLLRDIVRSAVIRERFAILAEAASKMGSVQVRNRATVGGNICNASPAADLAPPLLALDASVTIAGLDGERTLSLQVLFESDGGARLNGEILTGLTIPAMPERARAVFLKHSPRDAMDFTVVGVAVLAVPDPDGRTFQDVRIALGSVAATPIRVPAAEASLRGAPISAESIERAAEIAASEARPVARRPWRGSAEYRRMMVRSLTQQALEEVSL